MKHDLSDCWKCGAKPYVDTVNKRIGRATPHVVKRATVLCRNKKCDARSKKTMDISDAAASWNKRAEQASSIKSSTGETT